MELKEIYSKMSDKELMERLENSDTYFDDAKEIIINEIIKRELLTEKEIKIISKDKKHKRIEEEIENRKIKDILKPILVLTLGVIISTIIMSLLIPSFSGVTKKLTGYILEKIIETIYYY